MIPNPLLGYFLEEELLDRFDDRSEGSLFSERLEETHRFRGELGVETASARPLVSKVKDEYLGEVDVSEDCRSGRVWRVCVSVGD